MERVRATLARRSKRLRKFIVLGLIALAAVVLAGITQLMSRSTRAEQTYSKDAGYFYRFRASFELKETGERLDFDYVVACNIRLTRWRDGGLSDDSTFSPRVMVKATAGGQAVMLKTLNECSGLTSENDNIHPDILPIAIWFDSVEDLSNGLGYVSEDAYDSPLGKLKFRGARVDLATRADWEAWRKKSGDEYVERGALPGPWGYDYPDNMNERNPDIGKYLSECSGYRRVKLPEVIRAKVRPLWPSERPRFWTLPNEDDSKIAQLLSDSTVAEPPGVEPWIRRFGTSGSGGGVEWSGVPVRSGRWVQRPPHVPSRWPTEIYPFLWPPMTSVDPMTATVPAAPADSYVQKLEFRDGSLNGFAACHSRRDGAGLAIGQVDPGWALKPHVFMVDNERVRETHRGQILMLAPAFLLERDEYVFIHFSTGL
jgi:hypothetical protein